jgi:hypothetical protein
LLHSLVRSHALVDGNKRLAWLATAVFLDVNEIPVTLGDEPRAIVHCELALRRNHGHADTDRYRAPLAMDPAQADELGLHWRPVAEEGGDEDPSHVPVDGHRNGEIVDLPSGGVDRRALRFGRDARGNPGHVENVVAVFVGANVESGEASVGSPRRHHRADLLVRRGHRFAVDEQRYRIYGSELRKRIHHLGKPSLLCRRVRLVEKFA